MSFGYDSVANEVEQVLAALAANDTSTHLETRQVDLKEEAGRRGPQGRVLPGQAENEAAAEKLAAEAACMANTDGGGALILGVSDDQTLIGTALEPEWLRARIYEITERRLTVDVHPVAIGQTRLLIIRAPQAVEAIRVRGRIMWRVNDRCVEIDQSTWVAQRMERERYDWSAQDSGVPLERVRAQALDIARSHLRDAGDARAEDLSQATDPEVLRRLGVVSSEGTLTHAGVIAFVGHQTPPLDYIRRDYSAADSRRRLRSTGTSLLEVIDEVESAIGAYTEDRHIQRGLVVARVRDLPPLAVRESIVNAVVHRDWATPQPTVVEHTGRTLVVTSPGGFIGGVTPDNIITHPSQPRYRALAELFAALRLAEREGIGVDRMYRDMIAVGYPTPSISLLPGPHVRTTLVGENLDEGWIRLLSRLKPANARNDLTVLMLLRRVVTEQWLDVAATAPLLQLNAAETEAAIDKLAGVTIDGKAVIDQVDGVPAGARPAWRMTQSMRSALAEEDEEMGSVRRTPDRAAVALSWARERTRISTTELASIVGASPSNVGNTLRVLEEQQFLRPSRANRRGRGFYYEFSSRTE